MRTGYATVCVFFICGICMSCKEDSLLVRIIVKHYHTKWFFSGSTNNEITTIPFETINGWIVIKVKINDQENVEYPFVFDTGAVSSVEPDIAKDLQVLRSFTTTDMNDVESSASSLVNLSKLTIGKRTYTNTGFLISHHELTKCHGIKGIIGYNILKDCVFKINYKNQTITIANNEDSINVSDFHSIKMTSDFRRMMHLKLKSKSGNITALLDTGAPNSIYLDKTLKKGFSGSQLLQERIMYIVAANSSVLDTISIYRAHNLKLGKYNVTKNEIIFTRNDNTVGNEFLSGFEEVIINATDNRLYLSKKEMPSREPKLKNLDISWKDGIFTITSLAVNSQPQKLGLKINDQVTSINGIAPTEFKDDCTYQEYKLTVLFKNDLKLTVLRDGEYYNYTINKADL